MKRTLVLYTSQHGQTRKIAEHVANVLRERRGLAVELCDLAKTPRDLNISDSAGVVLAAPVHVGSHGREMISFVKRQRTVLARVPTLFLSISLSEAGAEDTTTPEEKRAAARRDVNMMLERFYKSVGFRPSYTEPVAGALMYTKYNPFVRFVMKRIARAAGASTDISRDHEFTNFAALTTIAQRFADELSSTTVSREPMRTSA